VIPDVDVDLELAPRGKPGFVRRPDLVVVHRAALERVRRDEGLLGLLGLLRACEVLVVVEIVSPGSHRTDHVIKRGEYADAGIPHYWIVDLDAPVALIAGHLAAEFGYQDAGSVTGRFVTTEPFPVGLRLDGLLPG
jgi:Uma2 family endonuclease